jgi:hypothetical protein
VWRVAAARAGDEAGEAGAVVAAQEAAQGEGEGEGLAGGELVEPSLVRAWGGGRPMAAAG